ncbi:MAG: energy transducer TonB [Flavobacteriales bacterium]|nr:energy transducer TonB [Flavobacteriales bacterium]
MKKSTIIISIALTIVSLTAFGFISLKQVEKTPIKPLNNTKVFLKNDFIKSIVKKDIPDFVYNIDHRFIATVTKEKLHQAKSIIDILPKEATQSLTNYKLVSISILNGDEEINELGFNEKLNTAQIELLQSADYSTNFYIKANCKTKIDNSTTFRNHHLVYYLTTIPEKEAQFKEGKSTLINYLKKNSKKEVSGTKADRLKAGKVSFIVTKDGTVSNVQLESTSGFTAVDEKMLELIQSMPGEWEPANNGNGEKIGQKLIFSFGTMGC